MAKQNITVYHTTQYGNGSNIVSNGYKVERRFNNGQLYGRGIYFWEHIEDAHTYGKRMYGINNYEIIEEVLPLETGNYDYYNWQQRQPNNYDCDNVAQNLLYNGIKVLIIPRGYIVDTTQRQALGNAYVWLVNLNEDFAIIS